MAAKDATLPKPKSLAPCGRSYCTLPDLFLSPTSTNSPQISQLTTITTSTAASGREASLRRHSLLDRPHKLVRPVPLQGCRSVFSLGKLSPVHNRSSPHRVPQRLGRQRPPCPCSSDQNGEATMKHSQVTVAPQSRRTFSRSLAFYKARPDKGYSLTDCGSMLLMRERRLSEALTTDRHFEQEGLVALLRTR